MSKCNRCENEAKYHVRYGIFSGFLCELCRINFKLDLLLAENHIRLQIDEMVWTDGLDVPGGDET